jgi:tRNA threonylcarbamoyladenosine biosynthesis protein TsaE
MLKLQIKTIDDIALVAQDFLKLFDEPKTLAFYGAMGAGKTTFIKALCQQLGVTDTVNSPTFAIINEYATNGGKPIHHFDLYRLEEERELLDIGFEDYLYAKTWNFIEWPEIAEHFFTASVIKVDIKEFENGQRELIIDIP